MHEIGVTDTADEGDLSSQFEEIKNKTEALMASEARLRFLISSIPVIIYTSRAFGDFGVIFISENVREKLGYDPENFTTDSGFWLGNIHSDDASRVVDELSHLFDHGCHDHEYRFRHKNGTWRWMHDESRLIRNADGSPSEIIGYWADITERKQNETLLYDREERYRILAEASPDQIFIVNRDDTIQYANTTALNLFNLSSDEVIGSPRKKLFPAEIAAAQSIQIEKVFETGEIVRKEDKIQFGTKESWIDISLVPLKDKMGIVTDVLGVARDITERKKTEDLLSHFNQELENQVKIRTEQLNASVTEKEILLKEIHHRVKNNMQVISSLLFMQARGIQDESVKELFLESQNRIKSIALVHEKLYQSPDLSRIGYADYLQKITRHLFETYHINSDFIVTRIHAEDVFLTIDLAVPCSLIINELITNSLKHGFIHKQRGTISITIKTDPPNTTLTYTDDGDGMPENFDLLRAETVGMHLIKGLVKQINGSIELDQTNGTKYTITFPG